MESSELIKDLQSLRIKNKRRIWRPFFEKYNFRSVCEVGVREGYNFRRMIEHNPDIAVAVDIWKDDGVLSRNDTGCSQVELNALYEALKRDTANKPFVKLCRGYSFDVVKEFPDEYFDFVYIDADHTYEPCLRDIRDWYPKVKKGGILTGDDYVKNRSKTGVRFQVIEAVQAFLKEKNLQQYFFEFPRYGWGILKI